MTEPPFTCPRCRKDSALYEEVETVGSAYYEIDAATGARGGRMHSNLDEAESHAPGRFGCGNCGWEGGAFVNAIDPEAPPGHEIHPRQTTIHDARQEKTA